MSSPHVTHLLTDFIDETLPKGSHEKFKAHLTFCNACRQALTEIRRNIDVLRGTPAAAPPAALEKRVAAGMMELPRPAARTPGKEPAAVAAKEARAARDAGANGVSGSPDDLRPRKAGPLRWIVLAAAAGLIIWRQLPRGPQEDLAPTASSVQKAPEPAKVEPPPNVAPPSAKEAAREPKEEAPKEPARAAEKPAPAKNDIPNWATNNVAKAAQPVAPAPVAAAAKPVEPVKAVPPAVSQPVPAKSAGAAPPAVSQAAPANVPANNAGITKNVDAGTAMAGSFSSVHEPGQTVVSDDAAWKDLWTRHTQSLTNPPAQPAIDFSSKEVIALFAGEQPTGGRRIEIMAVEDTGWDGQAARLVRYHLVGPPAGTIVTQSITHPFLFKVVSRFNGKTYFEKAP